MIEVLTGIVILAVLIKIGRNQGGKRLNRRFESDKRTPLIGRRGERPAQRDGRNDPDHNKSFREWQEYRANLKVISPWRSVQILVVLLFIGGVIIFLGYYSGTYH